MRRVQQLANQKRGQESQSQSETLQCIREKLDECFTGEIRAVLTHNEAAQKGFSNPFHPLFDFSKQSIPVFGVGVQQSRSQQGNYYSKVIFMKISLQNDDLITDHAEFISMTRQLLEIMDLSRGKEIADAINRSIGQLKGYAQHVEEQTQDSPRKSVKVKPWMEMSDHIIEGFELTQLHREIGNEIERLKEKYRNLQQNEKVKHLHSLGARLQTYPKENNIELIANFLSGVMSLYDTYPDDASKSILRCAYKNRYAITYLDDTAREERCFNALRLITDRYVARNRSQQQMIGTSSIALFHAKRDEARRASISKTPPRRSDTPPPSQVNLTPPKTDGANHFSRRYS